MVAFASIQSRLRLPLIAAPMFRIFGVDLVIAACRNGVIGAFPAANCRTVGEFGAWLSAIRQSLRDRRRALVFCPANTD